MTGGCSVLRVKLPDGLVRFLHVDDYFVYVKAPLQPKEEKVGDSC